MATWIVLAVSLSVLGFCMFLSYRERLRPLRQAIREDTPEVIKGLGWLVVLVVIQLAAIGPCVAVGILFGEGWGTLAWIATLFVAGGVAWVVERVRHRRVDEAVSP